VGDVDSLHIKIDNLNDLLVGFCFIRSIDIQRRKRPKVKVTPAHYEVPSILRLPEPHNTIGNEISQVL
jgi:hypothetical protein